MTALIAIVTHTPPWVLLVLALLVFLGVQALRPRTVPLARVFITPAVFIGWGLFSLAAAAKVAPTVLPAAAIAAVLGVGLALLAVRLEALRAAPGSVTLPGSALPLVRNLTIFIAKFVIAVAMAIRPDWHAALLLADAAVSGAALGYFAGWTLRLLAAYRRALQHEESVPMAAPRPL